MKKFTFIVCYSLFYIFFIFQLLYINNLYLWIVNDEKTLTVIKEQSSNLVNWNKDFALFFIKQKIKHPLFHYELDSSFNYQFDYDSFIIASEFSYDEIYELIKFRPESNFYYFIKLLKENDNSFFIQNDLLVINCLKMFLHNEKYKQTLKNDHSVLIPKLIDRVNKINEKSEYYKIYKQYLIEQLREIYEIKKH